MMSRMAGPDGFYEEDEPLADVIAAFDDGEKGRTAPPVRGWNWHLRVTTNETNGAVDVVAYNTLGEYAAS